MRSNETCVVALNDGLLHEPNPEEPGTLRNREPRQQAKGSGAASPGGCTWRSDMKPG